MPACLLVALATAASSVASLHGELLSTASTRETASDAFFPAHIALPLATPSPHSTPALHSSDPCRQLGLVGVAALHLSPTVPATLALYAPSATSAQQQPAVLVIRLAVHTAPQRLQQAVRAALSSAVETATGTEWDCIASCTQLDSALASLYLPSLAAASQPDCSAAPSRSLLPPGTTVSLELAGRGVLRVWLNSLLAASIESRVLSHATFACLAPLCTIEQRSKSEPQRH